MLKETIIKIYKKRFLKKKYYFMNLFLYKLALNGIGILNYENDKISGEEYFITNVLKLAKEGSVVIDVGANKGTYANKCKSIRLYA